MTLETFGKIVAGVLGLVMGSAVTAVAHRVPRGISWVTGRSACPSCGAVLEPRDLVPVLSFAFGRGCCRRCGARIAWRYPVTEILCAAWAILLTDRVGLGWDLPLLAVWGWLLIALLWIDLDFQLLPDVITFPGALVGVVAVLLGPSPRAAAFDGALGVLAGSGLLWLLAWGYFRVRKIEGMGGGDIKLAAMFGVVLGWKLTLLTLFVAAVAGSLWGLGLMLLRRGDGRTALPFGTLLAPAAMVVFVWGPTWLDAYVSLVTGRR